MNASQPFIDSPPRVARRVARAMITAVRRDSYLRHVRPRFVWRIVPQHGCGFRGGAGKRSASPVLGSGSGPTVSGPPGPGRCRTRCTAPPRFASGAGLPDSPGAVAARRADARPGTGCSRPLGAAGSGRNTSGRCGPGPGRNWRTAPSRDTGRGRGACRPAGGAGRHCGHARRDRAAGQAARCRLDTASSARRLQGARRTWDTMSQAVAAAFHDYPRRLSPGTQRTGRRAALVPGRTVGLR